MSLPVARIAESSVCPTGMEGMFCGEIGLEIERDTAYVYFWFVDVEKIGNMRWAVALFVAEIGAAMRMFGIG